MKCDGNLDQVMSVFNELSTPPAPSAGSADVSGGGGPLPPARGGRRAGSGPKPRAQGGPVCRFRYACADRSCADYHPDGRRIDGDTAPDCPYGQRCDYGPGKCIYKHRPRVAPAPPPPTRSRPTPSYVRLAPNRVEDSTPGPELIIFQDAENCFVPKGCTLRAEDIYNATVEALFTSAGFGPKVGIRDVKVRWTCVHKGFERGYNQFNMPEKIKHDLRDKFGVQHVDPGRKDDAVDTEIIKRIAEKLDLYRDMSSKRKAQIVFALLGADKDYSNVIIRVRQETNIKVVLVFQAKKCQAGSMAEITNLKPLYWDEIIQRARIYSENQTGWFRPRVPPKNPFNHRSQDSSHASGVDGAPVRRNGKALSPFQQRWQSPATDSGYKPQYSDLQKSRNTNPLYLQDRCSGEGWGSGVQRTVTAAQGVTEAPIGKIVDHTVCRSRRGTAYPCALCQS